MHFGLGALLFFQGKGAAGATPPEQKSKSPGEVRRADVSHRPDESFHAFLSYSHATDWKLGASLCKGLRQLACSPFRRSGLRIFRDTSNLPATPSLSGSIEHALNQSTFLILLACPESANSTWVAREIDFWLRLKKPQNILIALTGGDIAWDQEKGDFDWARTTALHTALQGVYESEPLWVDLRWARNRKSISIRDIQFRDCVAGLASPLYNRSKEELAGEDARQVRRVRKMRTAAIVLLTMLASALAYAVHVTNRKQEEAETVRSVRLSEAAVQQINKGRVDTGILLALEALKRQPFLPQAEAALCQLMQSSSAGQLASLPRPTDAHVAANQATFSPDGTRIVTAAEDKRAYVWDARGGKLLLTLDGHSEMVWSAVYDQDGALILTSSADGTARLWNARTGNPIRVFQGHKEPVLQAIFSPDGHRIATASADGTARIWNRETGATVFVLQGHQQDFGVCCVQYSRDGTRLMTASSFDGTARLWDAQTGSSIATFENLPRSASIPAGESIVARFSPDGRLALTAQADGELRSWRSADGSPAGSIRVHQAEVSKLAFSPDGLLMATLSADGTARVWDWGAWSSRGERTPIRERAQVQWRESGARSLRPQGIGFGADQNILITLDDKSMHLWSIGTESEVATVKGEFHALTMGGNGKRMAAIGALETSIWELGPLAILTHHWRERGAVNLVAIGPKGERLAVAAGREVVIRDGASWERLLAVQAGGTVSHIAFDVSGDRFLTLSNDGSARIWATHNGAKLATLGKEEPLLLSVFSPSTDGVATATGNHKLRYSSGNGTLAWIVSAHEAEIKQLTFSADGARILTASSDGSARVWEAKTGRRISAVRPHEGELGIAGISPDGDFVATGGRGPRDPVCLWKGSSGEHVRCFRGHFGSVEEILFTTEGKRMLTPAADGTARLWLLRGPVERSFGVPCFGPYAMLHAAIGGNPERVVTVFLNGRVDVSSIHWNSPLLTFHTFEGTRREKPCNLDLKSMSFRLRSAAISSDLTRVVTTSGDESVALFEIPSTEEFIRMARRMTPGTLKPEEIDRFLAQ
ncbi:MAG: TIR domain-containing protein [Bryobacterales bacterium]|nr:TIR domain-containing protein [Bryobacterales bacterium]